MRKTLLAIAVTIGGAHTTSATAQVADDAFCDQIYTSGCIVRDPTLARHLLPQGQQNIVVDPSTVSGLVILKQELQIAQDMPLGKARDDGLKQIRGQITEDEASEPATKADIESLRADIVALRSQLALKGTVGGGEHATPTSKVPTTDDLERRVCNIDDASSQRVYSNGMTPLICQRLQQRIAAIVLKEKTGARDSCQPIGYGVCVSVDPLTGRPALTYMPGVAERVVHD